MSAEAVPRLTAQAGAAATTDGAPVEDDEVARGEVVDVGPDGLDYAGGLVAEEEREVVVDAALAVMQVGVTHAACLHPHPRLARTGVRYVDVHELNRGALRSSDDALHALCHMTALPVGCLPSLTASQPSTAVHILDNCGYLIANTPCPSSCATSAPSAGSSRSSSSSCSPACSGSVLRAAHAGLRPAPRSRSWPPR